LLTFKQSIKFFQNSYKTNIQIGNELKITPILDKLLEYKRNWIQHVNRMSHNRLRVMKHYCPTGRRNHGRGFWTRETGKGQQVANLHDTYMMMMIMKFFQGIK
jgi:hypothetical protein